MLRAAVLTVVLAIGMSLPVDASLTISTEFREIVAEATLIVRGTITDVRAVADPDKGIESVGTIAVDRVIKGSADAFVSIRVPGGTIDGRRFVMTGAPTLRPGARGVYFLKQDAAHAWRPIGLSLGIFRVQAQAGTGLPVVHPPVVRGRTAPLVGRTVRGDVRRTLMPVSEFESLVALVMKMPAPRRAVPRRAPIRGGR